MKNGTEMVQRKCDDSLQITRLLARLRPSVSDIHTHTSMQTEFLYALPICLIISMGASLSRR